MTLEKKVSKHTQKVGYSLGPLTCFAQLQNMRWRKGEEGGLRDNQNSKNWHQEAMSRTTIINHFWDMWKFEHRLNIKWHLKTTVYFVRCDNDSLVCKKTFTFKTIYMDRGTSEMTCHHWFAFRCLRNGKKKCKEEIDQANIRSW